MSANTKWEVIRNYDLEDEEVIFTSYDYLEAKSVCDKLHKNRQPYDTYEVYCDDETWAGCLQTTKEDV